MGITSGDLGEGIRSGLDDLVSTFNGAGLVPPPVPTQFVGRLRVWGPWRWGTEDPSQVVLYNLFEPALEFVITRDVLLVGHDGHGFNSWALTYLLGVGSLALGVQIPWGGAYEDRRERAEDVARRFGQIARLIERAAGAEPREGRLLVVHSGLVGQGACGWVRPSDALETDWIGDHIVTGDVLDLALHMIA